MSQSAKSQIDPLNRNNYGAISAMLTVTDIEKAYEFCQKAFGFEGRGIMPGPDGKPVHAELKLRDSVLMLSPEMPDWQCYSAKTLGNTPATLYLYVEDVDKLARQAANAGATLLEPPTDMFWGDRYGRVMDPFGHEWGLATHKEDLTPKEVGKRAQAFFAQMAKPNP